MKQTVTYFHSLSSPWAYLGGPRFHDLIRKHDLNVVLRPVTIITENGGIPLRSRPEPGQSKAALRALEAAFNQPFLLVDVETGDLNYAAPHGLVCDFYSRLAVIHEVAQRGAPEIVEDESPLSMIAIPFRQLEQGPLLAAVG